ncbi:MULTISPECIES: NAD(+) diphosphatase [Clostridium]|uniref:NAD(+) diphosphatase n=1 Tax=Clostridium TaxID=1485 RepID=UPI00069D1455|nr:MULTISPECIES: NAD(+) diphosphatase [Clostridium]KOF57134.1 NUDIX hydrolase [Clostridium sp. DMHC 10]MCD2347644.1 NAD(+) diphosphatase [Clostridium guangxiense]
MSNFKILPGVLKKSSSCDLGFVFFKGSLLVKKLEGDLYIPTFDEIKKLNINYESEFFLGEFKKKACFTVEASDETNLSEGFEFISLREIGAIMDEEIFEAAGRASEILNWDRNHRFCGRCGSKTENKKDEMAKICPKCGNIMYPVICPAIIVGITNGDKILLAHNSNFKNNMYSLIAGFVETGENLKSAVKREIFEEVGIKVKNIRYYKSSSWPFPNSLMIGFFAEYDSGEIKVDGKEIMAADWFTKDNFPNLPKKFSLARKIIDEFAKK